MFLRFFVIAFLFFSFNLSASDTSQFEDHQGRFNAAKNSILTEMEEMLRKSGNQKLDIVEVVKNEDIQIFIRNFPKITTEDGGIFKDQIKDFLGQLLRSNFNDAQFIDKSGQSLAKTYLHQGNDSSTKEGNSSSSSSVGEDNAQKKILRAIKIYDLPKKPDEDDKKSDPGSNEEEE